MMKAAESGPCLRLHPGDKLKVWWYSPLTGHAYLQEVLDNPGEFTFSNWKDLFKEGQEGPDWVVVIDDAGAGYKAPGW